ncbi:winged helix-turn-helix domain-containing protein [Streptomyces sp. NPDC058108]|uniref:winged helix-turn-helix domain-containing protein n=1 Tax=Streptomyces sp. NPDC058108 TaxID=3346344 RepID=UPI0036ED8F78
MLEEELGKGPAEHGFEGQRWTLARVQAVICRRLGLSLSMATVWRLLKRHGWSWQAPARRALERDEHAVELWKREIWPRVKASRRRPGLDRLRGRGRILDDSTPGPDLGATRPHSRRPRPGQIPPPDLGRRAVLLQTG